jgi:class 3 adenylate cyclase
MTSAPLYVKDPATSRFVAGGLPEAQSLLGNPLPPLPTPEMDGGRPLFTVRFPPLFRGLMVRFVQGLLREIEGGASRSDRASQEQADYEAALNKALRAVRTLDRRTGLLNLFWLAHTRDVAECLRELETKNPAVRRLKYSLHPLLSSLYRRLDQAARRSSEQAEAERAQFLTGAVENTSLIEGLLEDGFAFTEATLADLDFNQFLAANKRYRLSADLFFEIYSILVKETERRLREGDRGVNARVSRYLPGLPKPLWLSQGGIVKIMMNEHILPYLLGDAWQTGSKLMGSARLKTEAERRRPSEILDVFLELVAGTKRFEILSQIRDQIVLVRGEGKPVEEQVAQGHRFYEFGESTQVLNNAVNAAVLFLDLRGFTQTSEGQISERDLTRELYTVFDPFVPHIRRFGGAVDKFLGDGMMVTFGTGQADPLSPLNALRTAILCQDTLRKLRKQGKTYFKMGIAIHYGRVYVARFIADESTVQTTVIGRNVNLAGRLSSVAKKSILEDDEAENGPAPVAAEPEFSVTVDGSGALFNEGIAISRETLVQLEAHLPLVESQNEGKRSLEYFDEPVGRRIRIRYAGDAKFKGVSSSFPVYAVEFEA